MGKLNRAGLHFHYLRVGKAKPLIDKLREYDPELELVWEQAEVNSFADFHFGPSYAEYDGIIINLDVDDENITEVRRDFWYNFIWKTLDFPNLVAIVVPESTTYGSLTKTQIFEALSLVRLTDRPYKIFENKEEEIPEIIKFLTEYAAIIHRKPREEEEENQE